MMCCTLKQSALVLIRALKEGDERTGESRDWGREMKEDGKRVKRKGPSSVMSTAYLQKRIQLKRVSRDRASCIIGQGRVYHLYNSSFLVLEFGGFTRAARGIPVTVGESACARQLAVLGDEVFVALGSALEVALQDLVNTRNVAVLG